MPSFTPAELTLFLTALLAALVNGALGYGFSSITVPVALGFVANRVLNPALVLLELVLNLASLFLNRRSLPAVWRRMLPLMVGLLPGVIVGGLFLTMVAAVVLKAATYAVLLPLILLQAAGVRWPIRNERTIGVPFGLGLGLLYSTTTISGPPLALLLNNQGFAQDEFRAAIALIRVAESSLTLVTYLFLGLYGSSSLGLFWLLLPAVVIGLPLGRVLLRRVSKDAFRRLCMGVDAALVSVGLGFALQQLGWIDRAVSYAVTAAIGGFIVGSAWQRFLLLRKNQVTSS
ncbi:sulfite exporter TauE/SafE family protein [Archangium violaceum]|uniref:sulfite exporter TauE/SafE family protein n=1 Tax=Archangium violaceum TaxID=83451 RepID=UPI00193BF27A|nr:sulfite exporter TauE/SafE family protein [Archangium violaceum]QRK07441.1 sulfite exporter TauE/SafE family protein [Archangium violaceum]